MSEDAIRRRSFPEAFKREAVAAIRGGRSVSQVAAELGLADRLVRSWLRWAEDHPAEASGAPAPPSRAQAAPMRRVGASPADQAAGPVLHGSVSAASTAAASRSSARAKPPSSLPRAAASHGRNAAWSRALDHGAESSGQEDRLLDLRGRRDQQADQVALGLPG